MFHISVKAKQQREQKKDVLLLGCIVTKNDFWKWCVSLNLSTARASVCVCVHACVQLQKLHFRASKQPTCWSNGARDKIYSVVYCVIQ